MRKLLLLAALAVLPLTAQAQFTLGARLGYGVGMGDVGGSLAMSDHVKSQIPIQLDGLFRVSPNVAVGAYLSYGFGQVGGSASDICDALNEDCSGRVTRFGAQAIYSFTGQQFLPWIGAGIGYEWNTFDEEGDELTFSGFEFLNLQAGGDYKVNEQFSVGPYAMFSIAQYGEGEINGISGTIPDKTIHQWFSFGLRGKFDL